MEKNFKESVDFKKMKRKFILEFLFCIAFAGIFYLFRNTSMVLLGLILAFGTTPARAAKWWYEINTNLEEKTVLSSFDK